MIRKIFNEMRKKCKKKRNEKRKYFIQPVLRSEKFKVFDCINHNESIAKIHRALTVRAGVLNLKESVLISGGLQTDSRVLSEVSKYDFKGKQIYLPNMIFKRQSHSLCSINEIEDIFVVGGVFNLIHDQFSFCQMLVNISMKWKILPRYPVALDKPGVASLSGQHIYTFGGFSPILTWMKEIFTLNLEQLQKRWIKISVMLNQSNNHFSVARLSPRSLLIFGGIIFYKSYIFQASQKLKNCPSANLYHDTLNKVHSFKKISNTIYTCENFCKLRVLKNMKWRDVADYQHEKMEVRK